MPKTNPVPKSKAQKSTTKTKPTPKPVEKKGEAKGATYK